MRGLLLSALLGAAAGVGAFTFHFADGLAYFSNDPDACANCHVMRDHLDSWLRSGHHAAAVCNDCHSPPELLPKLWTKADNGWNHSVKFTLQNFAEPIRIRPVNARRVEENCLRCHRDLVDEILGRAPHAGRAGAFCVHCHAGVGHGPRR